jgi:hypothetical protein
MENNNPGMSRVIIERQKMRESHEEYMKRRMRELDEEEGVKSYPTNYSLSKRLDKVEELLYNILENKEK